MKKQIILPLFAMLLACSAFSEELGLNGSVSVELNQTAFQAGEELQAEIIVSNQEDFPIAEGYLVVEIAKGGDFYYPPQSFERDNVFFEKKILNINLPAKGFKKIGFSFELPAQLQTGTYRLDVYFRNKKTFIAGIPHLFSSPQSILFEVAGQGEFPQAMILRKSTLFNGVEGQIASPVAPGAAFEGNVAIRNASSAELRDLELMVALCSWDDTSCEKFDSTKTAKIESIKAGEEKAIAINMNAPAKPDAYAIRIELVNSNGELLSLFRNRVIVTGATKKIRKIYANNYYFKQGAEVKIHSYVGPSPDHFTNPVLEGSQLSIKVVDLQDNSTIFSDSINLTEEWQSNDFQFNAPKELINFQVCGEITKGTETFDKYCFTSNATEFGLEEFSQLELDYLYAPETKKLALRICGFSPEGFATDVNAGYFLRAKNDLQLAGFGEIAGQQCAQKELLEIEPDTYLLTLVNNFSGKQLQKEISALGKSECSAMCNDNSTCTIETCGNKGCTSENLADGTACGENSECRSGKCIATSAEAGAIQLASVLPIVAIIIILALILVGYMVLKRRERA